MDVEVVLLTHTHMNSFFTMEVKKIGYSGKYTIFLLNANKIIVSSQTTMGTLKGQIKN